MRGRWEIWPNPHWHVRCLDCDREADGYWRIHWAFYTHRCSRFRGLLLYIRRTP